MTRQTTGITIRGDRALFKRLSRLEKKAQTTIVRSAVTAGARVVLKEAKRLAKGSIKKNMSMRVKKTKGGVIVAVVGPRSRSAPHAHLVEFGTAPRFTKDGASRGRMPAEPFMRPALANTRTTVTAAMAAKVKEGLIRETGRS